MSNTVLGASKAKTNKIWKSPSLQSNQGCIKKLDGHSQTASVKQRYKIC